MAPLSSIPVAEPEHELEQSAEHLARCLPCIRRSLALSQPPVERNPLGYGRALVPVLIEVSVMPWEQDANVPAKARHDLQNLLDRHGRGFWRVVEPVG